MKRWGADAIRDCDGTEFPEENPMSVHGVLFPRSADPVSYTHLAKAVAQFYFY